MTEPVDLGIELSWRKADWRARYAIPLHAPCLGVLWEPQASTRRAAVAVAQHLVQELHWTVPELQWALLANSPCRPHQISTHPSIAWNPAPRVTGIVSRIATEPLSLLEWLCGMDAWLISGTTRLAQTMETIASVLRIPCVSTAKPRATGQGSWPGELNSVAEVLIQAPSHGSPVAFQMIPSPKTLDAAILELKIAHNAAITDSEGLAIPSWTSPLRSAA